MSAEATHEPRPLRYRVEGRLRSGLVEVLARHFVERDARLDAAWHELAAPGRYEAVGIIEEVGQ